MQRGRRGQRGPRGAGAGAGRADGRAWGQSAHGGGSVWVGARVVWRGDGAPQQVRTADACVPVWCWRCCFITPRACFSLFDPPLVTLPLFMWRRALATLAPRRPSAAARTSSTLPPCAFTPPPYEGRPKREVQALRKQFLNPGE